MIKRVLIATGIALALSGTAFAQSSEQGVKSPSASPNVPSATTTERNAAAIAACDKLSGTQKADCLKEARAADPRAPGATGATGGTASGGSGTAAPKAQKDAAPASAPKAY